MKKRKHNDNQKVTTKDKFEAYLTLFALTTVAFVAVFWIQGDHLDSSASTAAIEIGTPIDPSLVCMVNDTYMAKPQIPVPVNGKTYYGCCQICVKKLNDQEDSRTATDPQSGKKVDKVEAYIVLLDNQGTVGYFESQRSYEAFKGK